MEEKTDTPAPPSPCLEQRGGDVVEGEDGPVDDQAADGEDPKHGLEAPQLPPRVGQAPRASIPAAAPGCGRGSSSSSRPRLGIVHQQGVHELGRRRRGLRRQQPRLDHLVDGGHHQAADQPVR